MYLIPKPRIFKIVQNALFIVQKKIHISSNNQTWISKIFTYFPSDSTNKWGI